MIMKPSTRKNIEEFLLRYLRRIDTSGTNANMYKKLFSEMTDANFKKLIYSPIPIYMPNGSKVEIDHMRNIEIARELGYEIEQYCWLTDPITKLTSRTAVKHLVLPLPLRRQSQMIDKKASVAEHNRIIDKLTGQPVGASKGSGFSFPQVFVLDRRGYKNTVRELIKYRGGDLTAMKAIDRQIRMLGSSSQKFEGMGTTKVKARVTAGNILRGMHIRTNL